MDQEQRSSIRLTAVDRSAERVNVSQFQMTPLVDVVQDAFVRAGFSQKAAALKMRMDQGQLSRALGGNGALALQKLELMPVDFWREFVKQLAPLVGLAVTEVDERQQLLVKMAAAMNDLLQYEAKR